MLSGVAEKIKQDWGNGMLWGAFGIYMGAQDFPEVMFEPRPERNEQTVGSLGVGMG